MKIPISHSIIKNGKIKWDKLGLKSCLGPINANILPHSLKNLSWSYQLLFLLLKCPIWNFDSLFKHLKYLDIHVCIFSLLMLAAICYMHIGPSSKMHYLSTPPTLVCFYPFCTLLLKNNIFDIFFKSSFKSSRIFISQKTHIPIFLRNQSFQT